MKQTDNWWCGKINHKRAAPPKLQKQPYGMPPPRPIYPKEREIYELNNNEDFLSGRSAKAGIIFHLFYIWFPSCKSMFALTSIVIVSFLTLVFWAFQGLSTNKQKTKKMYLQNNHLSMQNLINRILGKIEQPPLSLFPFRFLPPRNTMHFIRANVEAKAKAIAKSFIVESSCELLLPPT